MSSDSGFSVSMNPAKKSLKTHESKRMLTTQTRKTRQRTNARLRKIHRIVENLGNAKIAELQCAILEKHVLRLQIAVQNVALVHEMQRQRHLNEKVEDLLLTQLDVAALLDKVGEVAALQT